MNATLDTILHRRSVRRYLPEPVGEEEVQAVLRAGCAAPFGGPQPPVHFVVVRNAGVRQSLADAEKHGVDRAWADKPEEDRYWNYRILSQTPVLIAVLFQPTSVGGFDATSEERIGVWSAACAIQNMLLAATSLGLGACCVGPMPEARKQFEQVLGVQRPWEFLAFVTLGRPAEPHRKDRPDTREDMMCFQD